MKWQVEFSHRNLKQQKPHFCVFFWYNYCIKSYRVIIKALDLKKLPLIFHSDGKILHYFNKECTALFLYEFSEVFRTYFKESMCTQLQNNIKTPQNTCPPKEQNLKKKIKQTNTAKKNPQNKNILPENIKTLQFPTSSYFCTWNNSHLYQSIVWSACFFLIKTINN